MKIEASGADAEFYIREIILEPPEKLIDHLCSMLQLKVYSEISKNQDTFLYLEETGSVIRKRKIFKLGKANYYYALIAS